MRFVTTACLLALLFLANDVVCLKGRLKYKPSRSRSKYGPSRGRFLSSSSGLSLSKKRMLMGGAGLAAAYVGFKMANRGDLYRHTICQGMRREMDPFGMMKQYQYTVCPMNLRYCCRSYDYVGERCCAGTSWYGSPNRRGSLFGGLFGVLLIVGGIGTAAYCCCRARRNKMANGPPVAIESEPASPLPPPSAAVPTYPMPVSKPPDHTTGPPPPYFLPPSDLSPPPYPGSVAPAPSNLPYPPPSSAAAPLPPPGLGSGWGAPGPTPYPPA